jgi:hypothetical protein
MAAARYKPNFWLISSKNRPFLGVLTPISGGTVVNLSLQIGVTRKIEKKSYLNVIPKEKFV